MKDKLFQIGKIIGLILLTILIIWVSINMKACIAESDLPLWLKIQLISH